MKCHWQRRAERGPRLPSACLAWGVMVGRWAEGRGNNRQVPAGPTGVGGKGAVATYWLPRSTLSGGRHWLATHKAPRLPYGGSRGSSPIRDLKKGKELPGRNGHALAGPAAVP
jgi:hypothetical protein